ncbi:MAG: DUF1844 domain-containing protein [Candidatus Marinimicrobia bacterium]|nr:DUF1844 domain-containing protein [Candidatus Neomarinimicrobiota bacterium]
MSKEEPTKNEHLFLQLISSYSTGAWIGLGKMKNPVTGEIQLNLQQAQFSIDMLEMISERITTLADWESEYLAKALHELKMNYVVESEKDETIAESVTPGQTEKSEDKSEENNRG